MSWMAWTPVTAMFFAIIFVSIAGMTIWELLAPTQLRKGFLPLATTRGDRFFIGLLSSAFVHLFWLGLVGAPLYIATILCALWVAALLRWG